MSLNCNSCREAEKRTHIGQHMRRRDMAQLGFGFREGRELRLRQDKNDVYKGNRY